MKFTKLAIIASTLLALSTQVFASDITTMHTTKIIKTTEVASQSAAYEMALAKLNVLKTDDATELNRAIGHIAPDSRSLTLEDGSYITVAEQMNPNGKIVYTGQVNINVTYDTNS